MSNIGSEEEFSKMICKSEHYSLTAECRLDEIHFIPGMLCSLSECHETGTFLTLEAISKHTYIHHKNEGNTNSLINRIK